MPKRIPETITALLIASALSACAWQPWIGAQDSPELAKAATSAASDSSFVDYWQTRDPAEYRQRTPSAEDRKPVASSQDVVLSGKGKNPGKAEKRPDARISVIIPVQRGRAAEAVERKAPGKIETVAAKMDPVKTLKTGRSPVVSDRKDKRKSTVVARKDLWGRVRGRLALTDVEHARIEEQIDYLKRNPGYLYLFSQRAKPFLHYLVEQIDRRGLPMDLVMVPMVESAFEPTAVSPKEAAGLWQIIPTTGQERGLLLADGYDGRFDIHYSTEAALDYLRDLNTLFNGDWLLALAAYNAGPGAVREAIKAGAGTPPPTPLVETQPAIALAMPVSVVAEVKPQSPYWGLKLPKETQDYVPRILALSRIVANPEAYGLQLPAISNQPYLFRVDVAPEVRIPDALAVTGIPTDEFFRFNPGFKPGVEPPPRAYKLLLPWEQAQNLAANVPGTRLVAANRYTVKKGETLTIIAKRHGVPSQQLAQWNRLSVDSVLRAGQQLLVYPAS